jgi:cytochrome c oxidase assembly protein subunit 15
MDMSEEQKVELLRTLWFAAGGLAVGAGAAVIANALGAPGFVVFSSVLLLAVLAATVVTVRTVVDRRDLVVLAFVVVAGVVAQALVGGITVLTGLNPFIVGFHYVSSVILVTVTSAYLVRAYRGPRTRERATPGWFALLTYLTAAVLAVTLLFGVLTTANGPHSGDANVVRTGFDATVLAHVHSVPGYVLAGLLVVLVGAGAVLRLPTLRWSIVLLVVVILQVAVGIYQARLGLPPLAVGIHMVLAALAAAVMTVVVDRLEKPAAVDSGAVADRRVGTPVPSR